MCMNVQPACAPEHHTHGGQKRILVPQNLLLLMILSCHFGAGSQTCVPYKSRVFLTAETSLSALKLVRYVCSPLTSRRVTRKIEPIPQQDALLAYPEANGSQVPWAVFLNTCTATSTAGLPRTASRTLTIRGHLDAPGPWAERGQERCQWNWSK